jgi:FdhE protein
LRAPAGKRHNRAVPNTSWQKRIRRAEHLSVQHPFAAEILGFYVHLAHFQEGFYQRLQRDSAKQPPAGLSRLPDWPELLSSFPAFLCFVKETGPSRFAEVAHHLRHSSADCASNLLNQIWSAAAGPPDTPEQFLAFAFLQPYAELLRSRAALPLEGTTHSLCPFCNRKPAIAVLRPQGDGARRSLVCGFCLGEWEFRRIVCAGCGEQDQTRLPVYTAEQFPHLRVECCDACQVYIKAVDLAKNGLADPLVDELAAVPLDLWAREHGYTKLHPNLLGL